MKPTLLLLHGALGTRNQFKHLKPFLENHFDLYDFNFEGHGGVASQGSYTMSVFVENTEQFIAENNLNDPFVFGYSMGGYVALSLALKNLGKIKKIVTLGTKFHWTPESAAKEVKMLNPEVIEAKVPHFAQKLENDHHPLDWKLVMQHTADMMLGLGNGAALQQEDFAQIHTPVHLGIGTQDTMVSLEETEAVNQWLPNSVLHKLEEVPHPIEKANPEQLGTYIIDSLS